MNRTKQVKRGEIYMISLDGARGSEQGGYRPGIIIQNDVGNKFSPTTIVAFITSHLNKRHLPTHVNVSSDCGLYIKSTVMLEQIRTIDKDRLVNYVGMVDAHTMTQIDNALKISLGLEG